MIFKIVFTYFISVMRIVLKKQMFIITELVVKLARVYYDEQMFIIVLQLPLQPCNTFYMGRATNVDV